jgi:hypothetical protein
MGISYVYPPALALLPSCCVLGVFPSTIYNAEDIDELGIYASGDDELEEDEITAYLSEKRLNKNVSKFTF